MLKEPENAERISRKFGGAFEEVQREICILGCGTPRPPAELTISTSKLRWSSKQFSHAIRGSAIFGLCPKLRLRPTIGSCAPIWALKLFDNSQCSDSTVSSCCTSHVCSGYWLRDLVPNPFNFRTSAEASKGLLSR